jgi:hypothetical protein
VTEKETIDGSVQNGEVAFDSVDELLQGEVSQNPLDVYKSEVGP